MKVLIVAGWYPSKFSLANGDFIMYQTRALVNAGIKAAVIYAHLDVRLIFSPKDILHNYSYFVEEGVPTFFLSGFYLPKINSLFLEWWSKRVESLFLHYREKYGNPDILHAQTFLGGLVAMRLSDKHNIPYIITEHQTSILTNSIPKWKITFMKEVYNNASITIAVSNQLKIKMESKFTNRDVTVLPNFIDTKKFNIGTQKKTGFNFIAIGDLIERKGFDILIRAFKLFESEGYQCSTLTILGDGPAADKLSKLVALLGLDQKVFFPGRSSQDQVAAFLMQSDVFVLSSRVETFGIVVIEAMCTGLPVISTNCYGPLDIITESTGFLIPVDDVEALKNAMVYMYQNINLYDKFHIRNYVLENFSNEVITKKLIGLYESVI